MPAQWDEPFGLTLVEALASGTPVLGTRRGALPEIISPETGYLGDTLEELIAAIAAVERLDPDACRARVDRCFHYRVMAENYLRMYRAWQASGVLPEGRIGGPAP
jgi:glycosyltransferase involved in cell wall biosynthesis